MTDALLFWFLALVTLISGLSVVLMTNPIYSALSLAMTMVGVSALFVTLGAYFLAGVQLIVYAGAVMVLFVMVLMLFDLKHELQAFTRGKITGGLKIASVGILAGLVVGAITLGASAITSVRDAGAATSTEASLSPSLEEKSVEPAANEAMAAAATADQPSTEGASAAATEEGKANPIESTKFVKSNDETTDSTKALAQNLFLKNVFGFEALGVMLLVIAVGTVALSRSRGGTHARD